MKRIAPLLLIALLVASSCSIKRHHTCLTGYEENFHLRHSIENLTTSNGIDTNEISYCVVSNPDINAAIDMYGNILVTTGLLENSFTNIDFLKCALAHELAHYKLNHVGKNMGIAIATSIVFSAANFFIPGIAYVDNLVNPLVSNAYSRSAELDADIEAVNICRRAGLKDPVEKYLAALFRLRIAYPNQEKSLWSSHPPWNDRIAAVRAAYP